MGKFDLAHSIQILMYWLWSTVSSVRYNEIGENSSYIKMHGKIFDLVLDYRTKSSIYLIKELYSVVPQHYMKSLRNNGHIRLSDAITGHEISYLFGIWGFAVLSRSRFFAERF